MQILDDCTVLHTANLELPSFPLYGTLHVSQFKYITTNGTYGSYYYMN